jgi:chemotaxis protein MotA
VRHAFLIGDREKFSGSKEITGVADIQFSRAAMKNPKRLEFNFLFGVVIAAVWILGGLLLEKGDWRDLSQVSAAVIVFGGTCGAVVVSTPQKSLGKALRRLPSVLRRGSEASTSLLDEIVRLANVARRSGIISLGSQVEQITDPFLKKGIRLVADETPVAELRKILETDLIVREESAESDAKVFEAAGGYAPTIGIIGAVLGLIQVMKHLDNIQEVGRGIAVAFVATVYGVGLANIILLPLGSKIRAQARIASQMREMIIEGVLQIQELKNPRLIRQLLAPFTEVEVDESQLDGEPSLRSVGPQRKAS